MGLQTCLEVVLWGVPISVVRILAVQSNCNHQTQINADPIQRRQQVSAEPAQVRRSSQKQPEYYEKFFGATLPTKWRPEKPSKVLHSQQRPAKHGKARASSHCLWGTAYILSKHHAPSHVSASAKHHLTRCFASRKTSHDTTQLLKKPKVSTSDSHCSNELLYKSHFCISGKLLLRLLLHVSNFIISIMWWKQFWIWSSGKNK